MKFTLIGYGKLGKEVEKAALERGHTIHCIIDSEEDWIKNLSNLRSCDVAIEFTTPASVLANLGRCFENSIPVVSGTTGWHGRLPEVTEDCQKNNGTLFYASNFSIGANLFFDINRRLAILMNRQPLFEVHITETHHIHKLDKPSGTAVSLAGDIIANVERKETWKEGGPFQAGQVGITSIREGEITGIHEVAWNSEIDSISIRHEAKNRRGFAMGAVLAAEFIYGKKGIFRMSDLLEL